MNKLIPTILSVFLCSFALMATGHRVVVIPVEFSDVKFSDKAVNIDNKVISAQIYFNDQFSPYRSFSFELLPAVRLSREQAWYGSNSTSRKDERIDQLVRDACALVSRDLSVYDNDNDGFIDNICIICAGKSEADGYGVDCIWPQQGYLKDRGGTFNRNGKTADCFTVCPELSGLGIFCHEFAHSFGLQDLYDTDGNSSGGQSLGLWGSLSLMDDGLNNNHCNTPPNFCAIELEQLGIGTPIELTTGRLTLRPISSGKEYLRIDSDVENEYFLLECRDNKGWDAYIGGEGLLVYHIDKSANNSWYSDYYKRNLSAAQRWEFNQVNCRPDHPCALVLAAVPGTDSVREVFFPQNGHSSLGSDTDPAFRFWSDATSELIVTNIENSTGGVSFDIIRPISINQVNVFQDAAAFNWAVDESLEADDCELSWAPLNGGSISSGHGSSRVGKQNNGLFYYTIENLQPDVRYKAVIRVLCKDGSVHTRNLSFNTKSLQPGIRPFIYLNFEARNEDGSFNAGERIPLRVYNAQNAVSVRWFFNDVIIFPDSDDFWQMKESGILKARVSFSDGSSDIIVKKLTVK